MNNPTIYDLFKNSRFAVTKSCRNFSSITTDHLHEQCNAIVKEDGGEAMKDSSEWTSGWYQAWIAQTARTLQEFEQHLDFSNNHNAETSHHGQTKSFQERSQK